MAAEGKVFQYRKRYVRVATDKFEFKGQAYACTFQYRKRYVRVATKIPYRWSLGLLWRFNTASGMYALQHTSIEDMYDGYAMFQYRKRYVRVATAKDFTDSMKRPVSIPQAVCTRCNS